MGKTFFLVFFDFYVKKLKIGIKMMHSSVGRRKNDAKRDTEIIDVFIYLRKGEFRKLLVSRL